MTEHSVRPGTASDGFEELVGAGVLGTRLVQLACTLAVSFLLSRMSEEAGHPPREIQADYELVVRESTAGRR